MLKVLELFTWQNEEETCLITFDITSMLKDLASGALASTPLTAQLDEDFAETWISKRDINLSYCLLMPREQRNKPVLGAKLPDESILLIDGSHRYFSRYKRKEKTVDFLIVEEEDWRRYATIEGEL